MNYKIFKLSKDPESNAVLLGCLILVIIFLCYGLINGNFGYFCGAFAGLLFVIIATKCLENIW